MKTFKSILAILGSGKFWSEFLLMTVAMFISAAAVYYFLVPRKLIVGSISGLSIVLSELFQKAGIHLGLSSIVFIINAILLVLAYLLIDKEFGIKTVYTALVLGPMIKLWEIILPNSKLIEPGQTSIMQDPWFDLLCFVLILSAAQAILFRINASTGGLDILAKIFNKYCKFDIGTWINGTCVDYFTATINRRKRVCIISEEHERIRKFIIEKLCRGCSLYPLKGGYSMEDKLEIQALLTKHEFADLMKYISDNNIVAFITAGNVSEVYGLWRASKKIEKE